MLVECALCFASDVGCFFSFLCLNRVNTYPPVAQALCDQASANRADPCSALNAQASKWLWLCSRVRRETARHYTGGLGEIREEMKNKQNAAEEEEEEGE